MKLSSRRHTPYMKYVLIVMFLLLIFLLTKHTQSSFTKQFRLENHQRTNWNYDFIYCPGHNYERSSMTLSCHCSFSTRLYIAQTECTNATWRQGFKRGFYKLRMENICEKNTILHLWIFWYTFLILRKYNQVPMKYFIWK